MPSPAVPRRPLGVSALRPLGSAEVLDGAVRIVRRNSRAAFGFAVPIAFVQALLAALLIFGTRSSPGVGLLAALLRGATMPLFATTVLGGLLAPVVMSDALGESITAAEAWRRARALRGGALLVVLGAVVAVTATVGLVLAIVAGVWLWGAWAVAGPAMTIERLGPIAAVRRSFRLASSRFWRVWGVRALGWVLTYVLSLLVTLPFSSLAAYVGRIGFGRTSGDITHPGLFVALLALGQLLAVALVAPISAAIDGLLYLDLRVRVEGLDIVLAAPPPPQPPVTTVAVSAW